MNLLTFENLAQLLAIQPGAGRSLGGVLPEKGLEVRQLRKVQLVGVLKQCPAIPLSSGSAFCCWRRTVSSALEAWATT